jgi:hypothetical protein
MYDEIKIKSFIDWAKQRGLEKEQIKNIYDKALQDGVFNLAPKRDLWKIAKETISNNLSSLWEWLTRIPKTWFNIAKSWIGRIRGW